MNRFFTNIFLVFLCCFSSSETISVVCEFEGSATQREGTGRFTSENIDPSLCTHLIYSKASINDSTFVLQVENEKIDMIDKGYEKFVALKSKNPEIKLLIGTGGWNRGGKYSRIYSNQTNLQTFVKSAVEFLQKYKFDGLHFYLQYLYTAEHKNGVAAILTALQVAFRTKGFSISATVSPLAYAISNGYPISSFNDTLDFINVMAHSFHGPWNEKLADHHSRLYGSGNFNANSAIQKWIGNGISPSKIILGIPLFGTSWNLVSNRTQPPAPALGEGQPGKILKRRGHLAYYEICDAVRNDGWKVFQDPDKNMGPYAVSLSISNRTWVGYDDPDMAIVKANYALKNKLGGVSVWDVSQDDFLNICGGGINPMLTAIAKTLKGITLLTTTTLPTTSTINDAEIRQQFKPPTIAIIVISSLCVAALLCSIFYISFKAYIRRRDILFYRNF